MKTFVYIFGPADNKEALFVDAVDLQAALREIARQRAPHNQMIDWRGVIEVTEPLDALLTSRLFPPAYKITVDGEGSNVEFYPTPYSATIRRHPLGVAYGIPFSDNMIGKYRGDKFFAAEFGVDRDGNNYYNPAMWVKSDAETGGTAETGKPGSTAQYLAQAIGQTMGDIYDFSRRTTQAPPAAEDVPPPKRLDSLDDLIRTQANRLSDGVTLGISHDAFEAMIQLHIKEVRAFIKGTANQ